MAKDNIYKLLFREPPMEDGRTEFYFTSLAAIYELFTPKQVGCAVQHLYNYGLSDGRAYTGKKVTITREPLTSKAQSRPRSKKAPSRQ